MKIVSLKEHSARRSRNQNEGIHHQVTKKRRNKVTRIWGKEEEETKEVFLTADARR
ncbi:hypothetical protein HZA56_17485 [Candidatus Poribacteria bacterium]|nr:hypothetical protein [Candidatus Poribacteria bacterium]